MINLTGKIASKSYSPTYKRFISTVTVVGAGPSGAGIAQVAAQTGHSVVLADRSEEQLKKSLDNIKLSLHRVARRHFIDDAQEGEKFVSTSLSNLKLSSDVFDAVKSADIVVESIVEQTEAKQQLFAYLDKVAPHKTIFATNTSALSVKEIAETTSRKDRFGGLHFFNPVPVMKLLEVVRITETSEDTYQQLLKFGERLGKVTIACKDTPGFVVNRLLIPSNTEALKMMENGDATSTDIDAAMKLAVGYPMGPFEQLDMMGLDTHLFIRTELKKRFPDEPMFYKSPIVEKLVSEGKLGVKTGEGFYEYN